MADESTSSASDIPFAFLRHNAALALDLAELSCENRLRLQQSQEQALQDMARLIREAAQSVRKAADRSDMVMLLNSLSSAHFHVASQLWMHSLEAIANSQQALSAYATKACSDWARDLSESAPGSHLGTDVDAYWTNAYANFNRIFQTLSSAAQAPTENATAPSRA